jgi:hypothetical protein
MGDTIGAVSAGWLQRAAIRAIAEDERRAKQQLDAEARCERRLQLGGTACSSVLGDLTEPSESGLAVGLSLGLPLVQRSVISRTPQKLSARAGLAGYPVGGPPGAIAFPVQRSLTVGRLAITVNDQPTGTTRLPSPPMPSAPHVTPDRE